MRSEIQASLTQGLTKMQVYICSLFLARQESAEAVAFNQSLIEMIEDLQRQLVESEA